MEPTFRQSMNALHTWCGVVLAGLCFAIFWMGTLSVFDREIDRWTMPATRVAPAPQVPSIDRVAAAAEPFIREVGATSWYMLLPTHRVPTVTVGYQDQGGTYRTRHADPVTGALLPDQGTLGGTGFIFPFHYGLHLKAFDLGYWLVGLAGMAMLVLCVSGVVVHRRIFADFFLLRPSSKPQRTALDLHNVTGVLGLPFHFVISLSGLVIFIGIYWPSAMGAAYGGDRNAFYREVFGLWSRPAAGAPLAAAPASLDRMAAEARALWNGGEPFSLRFLHVGDAAGYVEIRRSREAEIDLNVDIAIFDRAGGALLARHGASPVIHAHRVVAGLHFIQFRHWTLRWLYFALGLVGCALIATGFLFWIESRRKRHEALRLPGVRLVEGLAIGSVTGIVLATLAFLVANRLLPLGAGARADLEFWAFYAVWVATFVHAFARRPGRAAWAEQAWAIAGLAVLAVALNALTTGDHLLHALGHPHLWGVAGVDAMLLVGAGVAALSARALGRRPFARALVAQPAE